MAICAKCRRVVKDDCTRCKPDDAEVERKFNKHAGGVPTSRHRRDETPAPESFRWPKFKPGTKAPTPPGGDQVG